MTKVNLSGEDIHLGDKFPHTSFLKHCASNYVIALQAKLAIRLHPALVVVQTVPTNRTEWIREKYSNKGWFIQGSDQIDGDYQAWHIHYDRRETNPFASHSQHVPYIGCGDADVIQQYEGEPSYKRQLILDYLTKIMDPEIKQHYDLGVLLVQYYHARRLNVPILFVLNPDTAELAQLMQANEYCFDTDDIHARIEERLR